MRVDRLPAPIFLAIAHLTIFTIILILVLTTVLAYRVVRLDGGERFERVEATGAVRLGSVAGARLGLLKAAQIKRKSLLALKLLEAVALHL